MFTASVKVLPWLLCLYKYFHSYCVCKSVTMVTVSVEVLPWLLCL